MRLVTRRLIRGLVVGLTTACLAAVVYVLALQFSLKLGCGFENWRSSHTYTDVFCLVRCAVLKEAKFRRECRSAWRSRCCSSCDASTAWPVRWFVADLILFLPISFV